MRRIELKSDWKNKIDGVKKYVGVDWMTGNFEPRKHVQTNLETYFRAQALESVLWTLIKPFCKKIGQEYVYHSSTGKRKGERRGQEGEKKII